MMLKKKKFIICVLVIGFTILFNICYKLNNKNIIYIDNISYNVESPMVEVNEEMYIPLSIFEKAGIIIDLNEDSMLLEINNIMYISAGYLKNTLNYSIYENRGKMYINTFSKFDYSWTENKYIAHAFGGIEEYTYTNSLEAFQENYDKGHRVFEVDFNFTGDGKLVAVHDWNRVYKMIGKAQENNDKQLTSKEFLSAKFYGKYTPLSFEDVLLLMKKYPDIYIVTDTKYTKEPYITQQFEYMVDAAQKIDSKLLERVIPQIYNEEMLDSIMKIYEWKSMIYTLYTLNSNFSREDVAEFCASEGIRVITTNTNKASEDFFERLLLQGNIIYMHTFNELEEVEKWEKQGVRGFYTDFLIPITNNE